MKRRRKPRSPQAAAAQRNGWIKQRIDLEPLAAILGKKTVPIHRHSWVYLLGGAAMFLFALQLAGGCLLMLYYQPTEASAHQSVQRIMTEVPYGWLVRSIHFWGANLFVGVVLLHFLTVLFTRAYRKPRELTWIFGALLLFTALGFGFSGYLLPWNELSYYATLVGTAIPDAAGGIGHWIVHLLRGGEQVTGETLTRFFAAHVLLLPLGFGFLLALHLLLVQAQGMSLPLGMKEDAVKDVRPFFREFILVDVCLWLLLFGAVTTLAVFLPAEMGVQADPIKPAPQGIKPEWYFLFAFETLKLLPERLGVALMALAALFLLVLPLVDRNAGRGKKSPALTAIFVAGLAYVLVFEVLGWIGPGASRPPEQLLAETYHPARNIVALAPLWAVIGYLIYYLRRLLQENTRVRKLYAAGAAENLAQAPRD